LAAAERFIALLLDNASQHALHIWRIWGRCFQGLLMMRGGDLIGGLEVFRTALGALPPSRFALRSTAFLGELAEALCQAGEIDEAIAAIDRALERSERHQELWCIAELLRIKGEVALDTPDGGAAAEGHFKRSIEWARRQSALSWELRTATSLARMWRDQHLIDEARDLLAPVYARFSEGFETADLRAARRLLDAIE
jgi:predicted ATPase